jgi:tetratricopeptide (TPR) repeat protein
VAPVVRLVASGQAPGGWWGPGLAAIYAELGMLAEAAEVLEKVAVDEFAAIPHDALRCASLAFLSDACCATGSRRHATVLQRLIAPWAGLNLTAGGAFASFGATDRLLGALAHCAGRRSEAIRHLDRALELNLAMRSATWTARTETELAAVLQDGDAAERSRAGGLLEAALRRARRYGLAASERHAKKVLAMRDAR